MISRPRRKSPLPANTREIRRREMAERDLMDGYARSWSSMARGRSTIVDLNRAKNWAALGRLRLR